SRRRHTRLVSDWSSDVCSSDLGVPVNAANLQDLRSRFAVVPQETALFADTVAANIAYGLDDASMPAIEKAARAAFAHDFIVGLRSEERRVGKEWGCRWWGGSEQ